ncbi:MAG: hypothetical protein ACP5O1_08535 [Phycisphaerae bacterium]
MRMPPGANPRIFVLMLSAADDRSVVIHALLGEGGCASAADVISAGAPARLDISGSLAAHTGGVVAQCTMSLRATAGVAPRNDGRFRMFNCASPHELPAHTEYSMQDLIQILENRDSLSSGAWMEDSHPIGFDLAISLLRRIVTPADLGDSRWSRGISISICNGIGLSGSIAAATAIAAALAQCLSEYHRLPASPLDKASMAAGALREIGLFQAHTVDALTALCAPGGPVLNLLRYRCQPHQLLGQIPLAPDLQLLAVEMAPGRTDAPDIARRVLLAGAMGLRAIETVYRDLGQQPNTGGYLGNISPGLYKRYFRALLARRIRGRDFVRTYGELPGYAIDPDHLYHMRAAVDHLIGEGEYAENFLQVMEELAPNSAEPLIGPARILSAQRAGRLLLASQHSYRLRLGLSSPGADWIIARLTDAAAGRSAYGARVTEVGDGRLVIVLLPNSTMATDHLLGVISDYGREFGTHPRVYRIDAPGSAGTLLN